MSPHRRSGGESLATDLASWAIGPYHSALPGPMRLHLNLDGEIIAECRVETGFLHRGLEKTFELHPWISALVYADRLDPEAASFGEMALALAVEEIGEISVPLRAQSIRLMMNELNRISCHLGYLARVAQSVGADTLFHYVLRDREKILDLFELQTGSRFSLHFFRYGGVLSDVTDGFLERVLELCDLFQVRLKEYNDLFSFNHAFLKRSRGIGTLRSEVAKQNGITGANARASGIAFDVRKEHPYSGYQLLDFTVQLGKGEFGVLGDAHDRFLVRLREISQSREIIRQIIEAIPSGAFLSRALDQKFKLPAGESFIRVESPRGLLGCHVVSEGSDKPCRVQFRVPSLGVVSAVPEMLMGSRMEDLPIILASLDIGVAEVDR